MIDGSWELCLAVPINFRHQPLLLFNIVLTWRWGFPWWFVNLKCHMVYPDHLLLVMAFDCYWWQVNAGKWRSLILTSVKRHPKSSIYNRPILTLITRNLNFVSCNPTKNETVINILFKEKVSKVSLQLAHSLPGRFIRVYTNVVIYHSIRSALATFSLCCCKQSFVMPF